MFKKILLIILIAIVALAAAVIVIWGGEIRTIASVEPVSGSKYLYSMTYYADYDLDEVISSDLEGNKDLLDYVVRKVGKGIPVKIGDSVPDSSGFSCTSFQAANKEEAGFLYGRNYDFFKNPTLVTYSYPAGGYASMAVSDMSHFGYGLEKLPVDLKSKVLCLASVYAPMDGINEMGLCTSIMALPKMPARQDSGKHKVGTSILMRLWLDRCSTVKEALSLLDSLDVCHDVSAGSGYHYLVADAVGNCAVVEFDPNDGWKTMIVRKPVDESSMVVTNHLLSPAYYTTTPDQTVGNTHSRSWWRYETAGDFLKQHDGALSVEEAQECLSLVHWKDLVWEDGTVEDTQYSCVYDQNDLILYLRSWNDYDKTVIFNLN